MRHTSTRLVRSLVLLTAAALCASACGKLADPAAGEPLVPVDQVDPANPVDPADPVDPAEPVSPAEPVDPAELPTTTCLPQAVGYPQENIPAFPSEVLPVVCEPLEQAVDTNFAVSQSYHWDAEARVLTVDALASDHFNTRSTRFELDEAMQVRAIHSAGTEGFYVSHEGVTDYTIDAQGRLVHKLAQLRDPFDGTTMVSIEKTQAFDAAGRLVERTEHDTLADERVGHWRWQYDAAGRLEVAELERPARADGSGGFLQRAQWTYDAADRPLSVARTVTTLADGSEALFERETWQWRTDGALAERRYERGERELVWEAGLDTLEHAPHHWDAHPWSAAVTQPGDACALPRGAGHGYPAAERIYDLGVPVDERPSGLGFAYGYGGYGWYYGERAWYGHGGVGSEWIGGDVGVDAARAFASTVRYDAQGRMVEERLELAPLESGAEPVQWTRTRSLDDQGRVVTDRVVLAYLDPATPRPLERELRFSWDEAGQLVGRELVADGARYEHQTWSRDAAGQLVGHEIWFDRDSTELGWLRHDLETCAPQDGEACLSAALYWRHDAQGRVIERGVEGAGSEQLVWDAEGRLVESSGAFATGGSEGWPLHSWAFDDAGRLVEYCSAWGESSSQCTRHVFDAHGRHVRSERQDNGGAWSIEGQSAYGCAR